MRIKKKDLESINEVKVIKAPNNIKNVTNSVFLAGSIEMGKAIDWQSEIAEKLKDFDVTLFNPRRDDWDSSWEQTIDNADFNEQVTWELDSLDASDKIVFYFDKDTQSPITLRELGLYASSGKCCVYCPDGFWRKGNVDIVCERFKIPMVDNIEGLVKYIKNEQ
jgi:hypothetical protein